MVPCRHAARPRRQRRSADRTQFVAGKHLAGGAGIMPPAIYSIPTEQPFLDTLVTGLMRRAGKAPLALAGMTVLLPTRRAARSLREAFLRAGEGAAMLLPRMLPVGDLDPGELALLPDEAEGAGQGFDLPPAVPELRRRLLLTQLVRKYADSNGDAI